MSEEAGSGVGWGVGKHDRKWNHLSTWVERLSKEMNSPTFDLLASETLCRFTDLFSISPPPPSFHFEEPRLPPQWVAGGREEERGGKGGKQSGGKPKCGFFSLKEAPPWNAAKCCGRLSFKPSKHPSSLHCLFPFNSLLFF